ncbi:MAG: alpha-hydroxy-acid oxidizing protein [Gammaproteobacteria bacterium]|nr:alpha-hydroxy-acid oxidizing protein [Gammaproteobacteria bacterium]
MSEQYKTIGAGQKKGQAMREAVALANSRRRFLRLLAASPLVAFSGLSLAPLETMVTSGNGKATGALDMFERLVQGEDLISTPEQAINVLEFEAVARKKLPPAHFGYLATGVDDDATLRANHEGFTRYQIRVRRLRDVQKIDTSVRLLGTALDNPIVLAPVGSQKAFHPDGEIAVAKAARAKGHLQVLSTMTSSPVEAVNEARGTPVWFQLYPTNDWKITHALTKRAEAAGCRVLVLTVDLQGGSNRETLLKSRRVDARQCSACHVGGFTYNATIRRRPMFQGFDLSKVITQYPLDMTWEIIKRLRDATEMKLILKGIVTREDAQLAVEHGADGIIVSNHGGRGEESNRATIESLPEVVEGAAGRVPVLVDGGFRRGTDIFKALALGASAVCIGRPYVWGLAAFGQPGVEAVLEILRRELHMIMRQAGTTSVEQITQSYLINQRR